MRIMTAHGGLPRGLRVLAGLLLAAACAAPAESAAALSRSKRNLIFPSPRSIIQVILGFGVPVTDLPHQSVTTGYVIKVNYQTPINATQFTRPYDAFPQGRKARRSIGGAAPEQSISPEPAHSLTRWNMYMVFQTLLERWAPGTGRQCLLRAVCDAAALSVRHDGLLGELLHIILTPSSTNEQPAHHDYEYHAAERAGRRSRAALDPAVECQGVFPGCGLSPLDLVSKLLPF